MKKSFFFACYFAVTAMLVLFVDCAFAQQVPGRCGPLDCAPFSIPVTETISDCIFNYSTETFCCVQVNYTKRMFKCDGYDPYYQYTVNWIKSYGDCLQSRMQTTKTAVAAIIQKSYKDGIPDAQIQMPSCMKVVDCDGESQWVGCENTGCCRFEFESAVDSITGDLVISNTFLSSYNIDCVTTYGLCVDCGYNCNDSLFPANGRLYLYENLPPGCSSTCIPSSTNMPLYVVTAPGTNQVAGDFSIGQESGSGIPCLSLRWFNILTGTPTLKESIEMLVKQALEDFSNSPAAPSTPYNIALNTWTCMVAPFTGFAFYGYCGEECCRLEFEITESGGVYSAQIVDRDASGEDCSAGSCTDVCDIFDGYGGDPFGIPKLSIGNNPSEFNNDIRIIPNPTTGIFNLEFNTSVAGTHRIKVVDLRGYEVFSQDIKAVNGLNTLNIDLTNIPLGVYYLQVLSDDMMISNVKFIKN